MAEISFPFDAGPGADSYEDRWRRMARIWAPSGVVGAPGSGAYDLAVSGLTATIKRRTSGLLVAEAWVDGFLHRLTDADWSVAVPPNTHATQARVDRIVVRLDAAANSAVLTLRQGTPAASPSALPLTQIDNGVWETPLWRFTVPANSGAPLTGLIDDRKWLDPSGDTTGGLVAYGYLAAGQAATTTSSRILGGLNQTRSLLAGRVYKVELTGRAAGSSTAGATITIDLRGIAGSTAPTAPTGTSLGVGGGEPSIDKVDNVVARGFFTVAATGTYAISPFLLADNSAGSSITQGTTLSVTDVGAAADVVGSTPIAVP